MQVLWTKYESFHVFFFQYIYVLVDCRLVVISMLMLMNRIELNFLNDRDHVYVMISWLNSWGYFEVILLSWWLQV